MYDNIISKLIESKLYSKFKNQEEFAKALGVTQATVSRYLSGHAIPSSKNLSKICALLEIDISYMNKNDNELISIPFYYSEISAGKGISALDDNYELLHFDSNWLKNQFLLKNTKDLFSVKVKGDSMDPIIQEGDLVFARSYDYIPSSQAIYIVQYNNEFFIKKIQFKSKSLIKLISSNKEYDPIEVNLKNEQTEFRIIAKVVGKISTKSFSSAF